MGNEVSIHAPQLPVVQSHDDLMTVCKTIAASGLTPRSLTKPEQIYVAILTGREAGLTDIMAVRSVYVINGTPSWKGEAALALIRQSGKARGMEVGAEKVGDTDEDVRGFMRWTDAEGNKREVAYTVADAKRAKLWGKAGPWTEHPKDMLMWRAVGRASKRYFGETLLGLDLGEVSRDYARPADEVDVTPQAPPQKDPLLEAAKLEAPREEAAPAEEIADVEDPPLEDLPDGEGAEAPPLEDAPAEWFKVVDGVRYTSATPSGPWTQAPQCVAAETEGDPSQLTPEEQEELGL